MRHQPPGRHHTALPLFFQRFTLGVGVNEEQRLVQAARRQDRTAFDTLVYTHQDRLRAFLMRRVGPDAVEDVVQETFLAAWQAIPRLDLRVRFKTWLFSIAVHKAADYHRSVGRRSEQEVPLDPTRLPLLPAAGNDFREAEQRATVQRLLEHLTDDQRQLLEMYYFAELTLPEIAAVLKRNLNTVKYQFYRAHAVAAQQLEKMEGPSCTAQGEARVAVRTATETSTCKKVVLEG